MAHPSSLARRAGASARRRCVCDDSGVALVTVIVIVSVLVLLAVLAFTSAGSNTVGALDYNSSVQADATAAAGLSAAVYDIESSTGSFPCQITTTKLLTTSSGAPENSGTASYSVSIAYYSSYPPTGSPMTCTGGQVSPVPSGLHSAILNSTGRTVVGTASSSETIREQLYITLMPNDYSVFSGIAKSTLNLTHLLPLASSGTPAGEGEVYSNGAVTLLAGGPCPAVAPNVNPPTPPSNAMAATIVSQGSVTLDHCFVNGSVFVGSHYSGQGNLVMTNQGILDGNLTVSDGSVAIANAQVIGNLTVGGSSPSGTVELCPNPLPPTPPAGCSGLQPGPSFVNGSATATGSISLGTTSEPAGTPPCSPTSASGDEVVGCITPASGNLVTGPGVVQLPPYTADTNGADWVSSWASAGDTAGNGSASTAAVYTNATCSGTGAGSVWADVNNETGPTVVIANCAVNFLSGPLNANYNTAIIASGGITLGGNFQFTEPPPPPPPPGQPPPPPPPGQPQGQATPVQISLIVPTPASGYSCSSSLGLTVSDNILGPNTNGDSFLFYSPCTVSMTTAINFDPPAPADPVEIIGGTVSVTQNVQFPYTQASVQFSPPGLSFGYQVAVEQRYVVAGG